MGVGTVQWPWIIGSAALGVWLISTLVSVFDRQFEIREHAENVQLRLLYGLLRLMESSPPGLISTGLKLQLCRYISLAFSELQQQHGNNAGYQACVDTAEAQIEILQKRSNQDHLPRFEDPERIRNGHSALPRFERIVEQLQQLNIISEDDARMFQRELRDRHSELEADTCLLRAERAEKLGDPMSAQRHYLSARLSLKRLKSETTKKARIAQVDSSLQRLQSGAASYSSISK